MDKPTVKFDVSKGVETEVYKASNLKEIKLALKKLGVCNQSYSFMSGMGELSSEDYVGIYFFSHMPTNVTQNIISPLHDVPINGKTLALFLHKQFSDPALILYGSIPHAKLGGWELWGESKEGETYLCAERILIKDIH